VSVPGAYRDVNFAAAFPDGLTVGCGENTVLLTSAAAVQAFLPQGGTEGVLDSSYVDPTVTSAGVFAGQVVALTLSVGFDQYDPDFSTANMLLYDLMLTEGDCSGMTVGQLLEYANQVLGGCVDSDEELLITINGCVAAVNEAFVP
jgi:hypothetical protein